MARSPALLVVLALWLLLPIAVASDPPQEEATSAPAPPVVSGFVAPQIILGTQKQPEFPPAAWDARYTGSVLLEMTVMKDGSVGEVNVVRCTRPKVGFEDAAIAAVRQWRFEPGLEGGEAIEVKTRLKLNFTRAGTGVQARPQVSAGSFTVASRNIGGSSGLSSSSGGI